MRIEVSELPEDMAELAQQAWFQREVVILRNGQPWVKLVPHDAYRPTPKPGLFPDLFGGEFKLPDDFCDTPEDIIEDFYK